MRFENPQYFYLLFAIIIFAGLQWLYIWKKKKNLMTFADRETLDRIIPQLSIGKQNLKFIIWCLAYFFLIFALANPQVGTTMGKKARKGADVMICLDISNSMLAEDIKPNRLIRAKQAISNLISQMETDKIGLVVFAGSAFVQLPLTADYGAAKTFVDIVSPEMIENQGTAIGEALEKATEALEKEKQHKSRTIVVISDGEDNEEGAVEAAKDAKSRGIIVNTIGLGNSEGVPIPVRTIGNRKDYKRDNMGEIVMSKLNEDILKDIAKAGGGKYIKANNTSIGIDDILSSVNKMGKNEYEAYTYNDYDDRFAPFALIALLLIVAELLIFERKNKYINRKFFFNKD
ncbi:MAG: VWA domain-containing protein [Bacteroidales bacterium]|jgi:Ca-activated chloride channel family protein|nr:VWA domain-containing protein [Bacteroidales bacterium]